MWLQRTESLSSVTLRHMLSFKASYLNFRRYLLSSVFSEASDTRLEKRLETRLETRLEKLLETSLETRLKTRLETRLETRPETRLETRLGKLLETRLEKRLETHLEKNKDGAWMVSMTLSFVVRAIQGHHPKVPKCQG